MFFYALGHLESICNCFSATKLLLSINVEYTLYRLLLLSSVCVLIMEDFDPTKQPLKEPKKFFVINSKRGSPGRSVNKDVITPSASDEKCITDTKGTKLSKMMRQMVLGDNR